jgi:hypothetical chaperone protein
MRPIGIDFGTTNSVAVLMSSDGELETMRFARPDGAEEIFPTVLTYWRDPAASGHSGTRVEAGQWAIDAFIAHAPDCRFLKSIKTFAASPHFPGTTIYGSRYDFADLMKTFLGSMFAHGGYKAVAAGASAVVGRPIKFAGLGAKADIAIDRYRSALRSLGFADLRLVYEPLAAAYYFVNKLQGSATIFVGDFGGGTSDYSIIKATRRGGELSFEPLATCGVGLAGDLFDARIIDNVVAPALGKGSLFRSIDKQLEIPAYFYSHLAQWNEFSNLRGSKIYREIVALRGRSLKPELLERFINFIQSEMVYGLSAVVARVKSELSSQASSSFELHFEDDSIKAEVTRSDFEKWIEPDLAKLDALIDETLSAAKLAAGDIDTVFLTGGSSLVPAVRNLFERRFGSRSIEGSDQLVSVAKGLALIANADDADSWISDARIQL